METAADPEHPTPNGIGLDTKASMLEEQSGRPTELDGKWPVAVT